MKTFRCGFKFKGFHKTSLYPFGFLISQIKLKLVGRRKYAQ